MTVVFRKLSLVGSVCAVVAATGVASASGGPDYSYRKTAADQALAAREVLLRSDLAGLKLWAGGFVKPDESAGGDPCGFSGGSSSKTLPVVTGHKETRYTYGSTTLQTEAQVLRSPKMVDEDWDGLRNATAPMVRCFQKHPELLRALTVVSVAPLSISHAEAHWMGLRILVEKTVSGQRIRMAIDAIGFARGRTELTVLNSGVVKGAVDLNTLRLVDQRLHDVLAAKLATTS